MSKLYLGIDPPPDVIHYPVIRTERMDSEKLHEAIARQESFTHLIFTSKNGVRHWVEAGGKLQSNQIAIAIGDATASLLKQHGVLPLVAAQATQEGVIALLESMSLDEAFIFYPRSILARDDLMLYLENRNLRTFVLDLYKTVFQRIEPVPNLEEFEEVIFTSPSTVEGFLRIFGRIPQKLKLTAIGPITAKALCRYISVQGTARVCSSSL